MKLDIPYLLANLSLEEKCGLCSGRDNWWTKAVERLGLPSIMVSDGPHGLRKQLGDSDNLGLNQSVEAVCFPSGATLASSFNPDLFRRIGACLGEEAAAEGIHTLLGPAINMKRSPLCGRNFEYLSEDPYLTAELATAYVNAVQAHGVGVSVKHFAANNQEYRRMSVDARISERALRELYLAAFERVVKAAKPWTVMCSYNRINGIYSCENDWLLNKVLRQEWGFDGIVMTDWGAMNDRVKALQAGLNLQMPGNGAYHDRLLLQAVNEGKLSRETLDEALTALLKWIDKGLETQAAPYDKTEHHLVAARAAAESAVLLKNNNQVLPLQSGQKVALIGSFAANPRFQGGGSSNVNPSKISAALDAILDSGVLGFAPGWEDDHVTANEIALREAVDLARKAEVAVVFAGLPDRFESEGYDRQHLDLPDCQNALITQVAAVAQHTVVVLHHGSPIVMPWLEQVDAVLTMYLGGQAVGEATAALLYGKANPSGHLAESFPLRLEDTPSYLNFPGDGRTVNYAEDIFIGYRYYDKCRMPLAFPFGYGLSYTQFSYNHLKLSTDVLRDEACELEVELEVCNEGTMAGYAVVQLYVQPPVAAVQRPLRELRGVTKIWLDAKACRRVTLALNKRSFAYYEERIGDWYVPEGIYKVQIATDCRTVVLEEEVSISSRPLPFCYQDFTTIADLAEAGKLDILLQNVQLPFGGAEAVASEEGSAISKEMVMAMLEGMPVHAIANFVAVPDGFLEKIKNLLEMPN